MTHPALSKLTLEEKVSLVMGATFWTTATIEHAGVEGVMLTDGPHGIRMQDPSVGEDHLGLVQGVPATAFPTGSALGSSWDPALLEEVGKALGLESLALGVDVLLGPGVNMKRSPLCGRNFEYFSEDPLHAGILGAGWVRGIESVGVGASVKHFAANSQETNRMNVDAQVDERTLREIYLPAFERVVTDADPATVMCSYNRLNGVYASENRWLLTDVLRGDWGFKGYVVSDWGAVHDSAAALSAGLDLDMPARGNGAKAAVLKAIEQGALTEATIDESATRILATHERLRRARGPVAQPDFEAHHALARRAASAGAVLLTNDGALPFDPEVGGSIAVIGELARTPRYQGAGSSHVNPIRVDAALDAIESATERRVTFAPGYRLDGVSSDQLLTEALAVAKEASVVVLFAGLPDGDESEGFDRTHIDLPEVQRTLIEALATVEVPTVVVLSNGGVVDLAPVVDRTSAILEMWLGGQASGAAAADVLFGRSEPGGRLAETIPLRLVDTPAHINWPGVDSVLYGERLYIGYRWYDARRAEVRFPFGHGLTYTNFGYSNLVVDLPDARTARATLRVTVTNTGDRNGSEVVQLYVEPHSPRVDRPVRELRAFKKVWLSAGESQTVTFELADRDFAYWGDQGWTIDPGDYTMAVGSSSQVLPLRETIALDVPLKRAPLTGDSAIEKWLESEVGSGLMKRMFVTLADTFPFPPTDDVFKLAGDVSLRSFVAFGVEDPDAVISDLERALAEAEETDPQALPASQA